MKVVAILSILLIFLAIFFWARWTRPPEDILLPLHVDPDDHFLKRAAKDVAQQPILVLITRSDPNVFSSYITQILKAEGLYTFETIDLSKTNMDDIILSSYKLIACAATSETLNAYSMRFQEYVRNGGRLLMFSPPVAFDTVLGIRHLGSNIADAYLQLDSSHAIAAGLTNSPLQYFGPAYLYQPTSAQVIAHLVDKGHITTSYPAVGLNTFGTGRAGFFAFDPGSSIVFMRQGKPPVSNNFDRDGDGVFKTTDLFYDSFDYANARIPQADEQQKLLIKLIFYLLEGDCVIPRVWYFPNGNSTIALVTGDSHGEYWNERALQLARYVEARNGRFTIINYPEAFDSTTLASFAEGDHTVAPHIYYPRPANRMLRLRQLIARFFSGTAFFQPRLADVDYEIREAVQSFNDRTGTLTPLTRLHFLIWWGWSETAQLLAQHGFRLDLSITGMNPHFPYWHFAEERSNSPGGFGYINGSGLPMKFVGRDGSLINLYGQSTQFEDDVVMRELIVESPGDTNITQKLIERTLSFIDDANQLYHTALTWNFHPENTVIQWPAGAPTTWEWFTATVDYLAEQKIPMLSASEWLRFVDARNSITLKDVAYTPKTRSGRFSISARHSMQEATILIPVPSAVHGTQLRTILVDTQEPPLPPLRKEIDATSYFQLILDLQPNITRLVEYSF